VTEEVELDADPLELQQTLHRFRQGDVLDVARMTWLFSPDYPLNPDEEEADAGEPVAIHGRLSQSGLSVIVSQTCDIWRLPDSEPFVTLCSLVDLDDERYSQARRGLSVRYFPYPGLPDRPEDEQLAVDGRLFYSLEKTALQSGHIEHFPCSLSDPVRADLRVFLAQRLGRPDFPDEVVSHLIGPVERGFKRVHGNTAFGSFFDCVIFYGVRWTPQATGASVLVLTSPSRRRKFKVGDQEVDAAAKRLRNSLDHWTQDSPYEVTLGIHDADRVSAMELLQYHELRLDLEAARIT